MQQGLSILDGLINSIETSSNDDDCKEAKIEICDEKYMRKIWSKYESIPNSYHTKTVEYITEHGHTNDDIVWCASEKVHGANFSLITNGVDVMAGSRTQILDETTKFYGGWREVLAEERDRALNAFELLNKTYNNQIKVVIIYGEIFGGLYSHPQCQSSANSKKKCVQTGIYYSPEIKFYAFDIKTDLEISSNTKDDSKENEDEEEIDGRLCVNEAVGIFEKCGFLHAKILQKGTFAELMNFDVDVLQSTIPNLLNLPAPIDMATNKELDNVAEGIVIRKMFSKDHCLLKIKAKKFLEIEAKQKKKGKKNKGGDKGGNKNANLEVSFEKTKANVLKFQNEDFVEFIMRCINETRLQAVESKIGKMSVDNAKKMQGLLMNDVFKELQSEKADIMKSTHKSDIGKIRGFIAVATKIFFQPKLEELEKEQENDNQ